VPTTTTAAIPNASHAGPCKLLRSRAIESGWNASRDPRLRDHFLKSPKTSPVGAAARTVPRNDAANDHPPAVGQFQTAKVD
jgi:hypothetical protein